MKIQKNPNTFHLSSKRNSAFIILICFLFHHCLSFQESRLVSKQQIGDAVAIPEYTLFSIPTLKENFLIFEIKQKANYRFLANIKTNTSLKRDRNGTLCSGFGNTEDSSDHDCDDKYYFFGLGVATIITVGTILPVLLVFDWIPALFKIGENESTEETSEVKTIDPCQIKNENAILEYSFGESWDRIKKVPIKNCSATDPYKKEYQKYIDHIPLS